MFIGMASKLRCYKLMEIHQAHVAESSATNLRASISTPPPQSVTPPIRLNVYFLCSRSVSCPLHRSLSSSLISPHLKIGEVETHRRPLAHLR